MLQELNLLQEKQILDPSSVHWNLIDIIRAICRNLGLIQNYLILIQKDMPMIFIGLIFFQTK